MVSDFSDEDKASGIKFSTGVLGRESPTFGNFAPPDAQNQTYRRARGAET